MRFRKQALPALKAIPSDANSNAVDSTAVFSPVYESDPLDPPEIAVQEKKNRKRAKRSDFGI